jgi:hypothetical protein
MLSQLLAVSEKQIHYFVGSKMASSLPLELLEKIFSNLHSKILIVSCRGVCRTWRDVIDNEVLMRRALVTPELRRRFQDQNFNFQVYFQIEKTYGRNLLKNIHFRLKDPKDFGLSIIYGDNSENKSSKRKVFMSFCTVLFCIV